MLDKITGSEALRFAFDHFADCSAIHRLPNLEGRHLAFRVVHPATHVGVYRQPAIADADHPVTEFGEGQVFEFEIVVGRRAAWAALEMPGAGHRRSSCLSSA